MFVIPIVVPTALKNLRTATCTLVALNVGDNEESAHLLIEILNIIKIKRVCLKLTQPGTVEGHPGT